MSVDQRVRDGLGGMSAALDEPLLVPLLDETIARGKRRRRIRKTASATVALVAVTTVAAYAVHALGRVERAPITPPVAPGLVTTVVGNGVGRSSGDGGLAVDAAILKPGGIVLDDEGNLYVAEGLPGRAIRKVDASGRISTVAGSRTRGGADLAIMGPGALAIDGHGNLYIAGGPNGSTTVFMVDRSGTVTRVAGSDEAGYAGDGGPATRAEFDSIYDIALDDEGRLYIVDTNNARIRMVDEHGVVDTIAGTGQPGFSGDDGLATEAMIDATSICLDPRGGIVISGGEYVRRIDQRGIITTVAGPSIAAAGSDPRILNAQDIACDADGDIYVADSLADEILKIDASGHIEVIAGSGGRGFEGDGGLAPDATFADPERVTIGPDGALYVSDVLNNRVREITL